MNKRLQLLVFVLGERRYGLYLSQIVRVVRAVDVTPLPGAPNTILGAIDLQGEVAPVFNVRRRLGLTERDISQDDQFIVATTSKRTVVLAVDTVQEIVEIPAEHVIASQAIVGRLELIAGVIQLEGGLTLIHELERFLSLDEERELEAALVSLPNHANHQS